MIEYGKNVEENILLYCRKNFGTIIARKDKIRKNKIGWAKGEEKIWQDRRLQPLELLGWYPFGESIYELSC